MRWSVGIEADGKRILSREEIASMVENYLPLVADQADRVWLSPRIGLTRGDLISGLLPAIFERGFRGTINARGRTRTG